ncbi:hypothetical protein LZQ00_16065 [Sphingobacterium sp. SRCM116780]|uniref:hypothetical protein n=1 Tax=Sphingobacterium sp. SRCM116780 TaxID=2907623 RepID=UPI001F4677FA|nr:hypothetical protein [Sphingobacterium sp. SRCM116780]UIR55770.1 hypothetical protein LZQ00_16065 [Sphingobacterium sp. SRCM116780]
MAPIAFAQKKIEGIVSDQHTKQRISTVSIRNTRTKSMVFNNTKGEFSIFAETGDTLIATSKEYFADTLLVKNTNVILFHLRRESIYIDEVSVVAKKDPDEILKNARIDYEKAFRLSEPGDLFSVGQNGAGLSINSIYSLFSREAKNAKRLKKIIENDYKDNIVDYKFSEQLVSRTTGLTGDELNKFRRIFRPNYFFIVSCNQYELTNYIKECYQKYQKNPSHYFIEPLPTINHKLVP